MIKHGAIAWAFLYLASAYSRNPPQVLEILGELEVAHSDPMTQKTDGNHIFVNVIPTIEMNPTEIADELAQRLRAR